MRNIPGYMVLVALFILALAGIGVYKLFDHKSYFERMTSYKTPEELLKADNDFHSEVIRSILQMAHKSDFAAKAQAGDPEAEYQMGNMFLYGIDSGIDYVAAREWFFKADAQGYAPAAYQIGAMYANGFGEGQSEPEAMKWYRKAAEEGDAWAQRHVGEIYMSFMATPFGVKRDMGEAYFWLSLGTEGRDTQDEFDRDRETAKAALSAAARQEVEARLKAWHRARHASK